MGRKIEVWEKEWVWEMSNRDTEFKHNAIQRVGKMPWDLVLSSYSRRSTSHGVSGGVFPWHSGHFSSGSSSCRIWTSTVWSKGQASPLARAWPHNAMFLILVRSSPLCSCKSEHWNIARHLSHILCPVRISTFIYRAEPSCDDLSSGIWVGFWRFRFVALAIVGFGLQCSPSKTCSTISHQVMPRPRIA